MPKGKISAFYNPGLPRRNNSSIYLPFLRLLLQALFVLRELPTRCHRVLGYKLLCTWRRLLTLRGLPCRLAPCVNRCRCHRLIGYQFEWEVKPTQVLFCRPTHYGGVTCSEVLLQYSLMPPCGSLPLRQRTVANIEHHLHTFYFPKISTNTQQIGKTMNIPSNMMVSGSMRFTVSPPTPCRHLAHTFASKSAFP